MCLIYQLREPLHFITDVSDIAMSHRKINDSLSIAKALPILPLITCSYISSLNTAAVLRYM